MGGALWEFLHGEWSAGKMWSVIVACWFFVTTYLCSLFRLIKPTSTKSTKKLSSELMREENETNHEENEKPAFVFKFPVMSPEEIRRMVEEKPATTIQSYRFAGARGYTGFVEGPEMVNLKVEYAFVGDEERPPNEELMRERDVDEYIINNRQDKSSEAMVEQCPVPPQEEAIKPDGLQSDGYDESLSVTRPLMKTKYLYQKDFFPTFQESDSDDSSSLFEEDGLSSNGSESDELLSLNLGETEANLMEESDSERSPVNKEEFDEKINDMEDDQEQNSSLRSPVNKVEFDEKIENIEDDQEHNSSLRSPVHKVEFDEKIEDIEDDQEHNSSLELEEDVLELMNEEELSESKLAEHNSLGWLCGVAAG